MTHYNIPDSERFDMTAVELREFMAGLLTAARIGPDLAGEYLHGTFPSVTAEDWQSMYRSTWRALILAVAVIDGLRADEGSAEAAERLVQRMVFGPPLEGEEEPA